MNSIIINDKVKEQITLDNYNNLLLETKEEKILCSLMVNLCVSDEPMTPKTFVGYYCWLAYLLHIGLSIDYKLYPALKDKVIVIEAKEMKKVNYEFMRRDSCLQIAKLITEDQSESFQLELESEFKHHSFSRSF